MVDRKLDPIKYEQFYNRLQTAMTEAKDVTRLLSAAAIVRESGEVAQGFFLPNGESVVLASGMVLHVATITRTIRSMIEENYEEDIGFYDGDQFFNNDAHVGGMHTPDQIIVAPIFYDEKLIGWSGNFGHVSEVGAIEPGGMCPAATESFHEGIRLPGVKIVERGKLKRDLMRMMGRMVRNPREIQIDTRAKIAGNERAKQKIREIIEEFGIDFFLAASEQLVKDSEAQARATIKTLRPGIYRSRLYADTPGLDLKLCVIELEMEVTEDGELHFTIPLVSPQRRGYNNSAFPCTEAEIFVVLMTQLFYKGRWNSGAMRAATISVPERSMLNADSSAAVGYAVVGIGLQLVGNMNDAISRASFIAEKHQDIMAPGPAYNAVIYGGLDQFGRPCGGVTLECTCGGSGARYDRDGLDSSGCQLNPWSEAPDVEAQEMRGPLLSLSRKYLPDTCGFGKFRGSNGVEAVLMVNKSSALVAGSFGSSYKASGLQGLYGGYPEAVTQFYISRGPDLQKIIEEQKPLPHRTEDMPNHGEYSSLPPSTIAKPVHDGDLLGQTQWGGAGLGDPVERDPELVVRDLQNKMVTLRPVQEIYCVEIDPETFEVDYKKTEERRTARRKERLSKGIPAKEYIKMMVEKRKNRDLPKPVLEYLDETTSFCPRFRQQLEFEEQIAKEG